ncbi:uncharacterized protein LOC127874891 [Dreissena polymorpha]|uniref:Uncharacterized protein n=1 Tax=Dreissena polymorpha TaxID=45954 RepID=A0A9D4R3P7_DREPO|nr:uncharacterized protein LOC127874891 [Dreissena polymorpha]KAH3852120.1 hypothetical protein DPMN_094618 [Dreissena polymorpha]
MTVPIGEDTCPRCQKCDRWRGAPDYVREPMLLWDQFPCPPPVGDKAKLLLELDWNGRLGPQYGCLAFRRVAKRCKVDVTSLKLPDSLNSCDSVYSVLGLCGTQCVIAIILACICLLFVCILVVVCCRYVRRGDKSTVQTTCTKIVSADDPSLHTQLSRYYVQSQYYYRAGNIPERRGLPFEVRSTENGVEARLIQAIQQVPIHQEYPFDETCSQCRHNASRQSTLSTNRSRQGYERIYWRDKEAMSKHDPSSDSLIHRRQSDRQKSVAGSSSDMSHYYDYISDTPPYDSGTVCSRRSNHSILYIPRNASATFKDSLSHYNDSRCSNEDRSSLHSRYTNKEIVPLKSEVIGSDGSRDGRQNLPLYGGSLKGHYCSDSGIVPDRDRLPTSFEETTLNACSTQQYIADDTTARVPMKGYKYTYNPYFDEDTTTTSRNNISSSPGTPSSCMELEGAMCTRDQCDTSSSPNSIKLKVKGSRASSLRSNRNSDSTSLSDSASVTNIHSTPRTNGTFYKSKRPK